MLKLAILRLSIKIIGVLVIMITAGIWCFLSSSFHEIYIAMNPDIQFEKVGDTYFDEPEFRATSSVNMRNIPDNVKDGYKLKIKVNVYEDEDCTRDITDKIEYTLENELAVKNGTQPVRMLLKMKDSARTHDSFHVVMSAVVEKVNI